MPTITFYPDAWHAPQGLSSGSHFHAQSLACMARAIKNGGDFETTQMGLLDEDDVKRFDEIRIIDRTGITKIVNNHDGTYECARTDKEIRRAHNLYHMWRAGVFDLEDKN